MNTLAKPLQSQNTDRPDVQSLALRVLEAEADAIRRIALTDDFAAGVDLIAQRTADAKHGNLVVSGLGKSGLIGRKLSATFASTGTPSHFLHPTEAVHGDLGRVRRDDVVLLLSFGGGTEEILTLASLLKQDQVPTIALVGPPDCHLARLCDLVLPVGDVTEACPLNLAPTASSTAMLALGDALALCVSNQRHFSVDDFHRVHPGGSLGRQLMPVTEALRFKVGENLTLASPEQSVREAIEQAATALPGLRRAGALLIVDEQGRLAGIFTDGDLVRLILAGQDPRETRLKQVMIANPRHVRADALVRDVVQLVREHRIDEVPVVDEAGRPVGLIDVQDLLAQKILAPERGEA